LRGTFPLCALDVRSAYRVMFMSLVLVKFKVIGIGMMDIPL